MPTFNEAARTVHEANKPRWRNGSHTAAWIQTLERHAFPKIGKKRIDTISRADVLTVLTPIWSTRPETARRVRQRMRTIFKWAMANELIEANPAGEAIDGALPSMPKVKSHLRALPYQEVGSALEAIDASQTSPASKHCLKLLVFTAARSGEARGATWGEIDLDSAAWTIPGSRMKSGVEHRVPLSDQALDVLALAQQLEDGSGLWLSVPLAAWPDAERHDPDEHTPQVWPGGQSHGSRIPNVLQDLDTWNRPMRRGQSARPPWHISLAAASSRHMRRSDLFDRRRALMQQWADYLAA